MQEAPKAAVSSSSGLTVSSQMQTALDQGAGNPDPPSPSFTPPPEEKVSQVPHFAAASALGNVKAVGTNRIFWIFVQGLLDHYLEHAYAEANVFYPLTF